MNNRRKQSGKNGEKSRKIYLENNIDKNNQEQRLSLCTSAISPRPCLSALECSIEQANSKDNGEQSICIEPLELILL